MSSLEAEVEDGALDGYLDEVFESVSAIDHPDIEGFTLQFRDPPEVPAKSTRTPKVVLAWEEFLEFLTTDPGRWVQVWEFSENGTGKHGEVVGPKARAIARKRSMYNRLVKVRPDQIWDAKVASDPGTETWGVYAQFVRPATPAEIAERQAKHDAAVARGKHAADVRAKNAAA